MNERVVPNARQPEISAQLGKLHMARSPVSFLGLGFADVRSYWLIGGLVTLLLLAAVVIWSSLGGGGGAVYYATAPVTRGSVTHSVTATGTVNPELTIIVGTYVSGPIQALYCDYNTPVKKGQVCAKIDPRPYQTVVDQNKASLAVAKAQLDKDQP